MAKFGLANKPSTKVGRKPVEEEREDEQRHAKSGSDKLVIPKKLGPCADLLYKIRDERLELERRVREMEHNESVLKEHIIRSLPKQDSTGIRGKVAQVTTEEKDVATAKDWTKIHRYMKRFDAFDLVHRRLNEAAVQARLDAGEKIPGVGTYHVTKLHCIKLGSK